jgi:hypothetical protein
MEVELNFVELQSLCFKNFCAYIYCVFVLNESKIFLGKFRLVYVYSSLGLNGIFTVGCFQNILVNRKHIYIVMF